MTDTTAPDQLVFPDVNVPGSGEDPTPQVLRREIDEWIQSEAFQALLVAEGGQPTGLLRERLAYLDGFSAAAWDFRAKAARLTKAGYLERNQVAVDEVDGEREALATAAARALGLVEARPPASSSYDHVLVLGGLVRANVWRSAYAAHLLTAGRVQAPVVTGLTAFRELARNDSDPSLDEPSLLSAFGLPDRQTEAEVMEDALVRAFGLESALTTSAGGGDENGQQGRFRVASHVTSGLTVDLVAAPNPRSSHRANTAQTMTYWAQDVVHLRPGQTILFVTSSIYVPFQHAVAVQSLGLPFGARVETIGVDHTIIEPAPMPQTFRGVHFLQELRSAVRAYRQLLEAATETDGD